MTLRPIPEPSIGTHPFNKRRNDNGIAEWELEQSVYGCVQQNEHSQVPLPNRLSHFINDVVVSAEGVTKLLKDLNHLRL